MPRNIRQFVSSRAAISEALIGQIGWTTASYMVVQIVRFAQNLLLTHILAPDLFGVMIILTSLRVGVELFTDIGIGQNVIANKDAWKPEFYNTAWTLQIIRGLLIGGVFFIFLPVISSFYDDKTLNSIFPILSIFFILTGTHSMGLALAAKALETKRLAWYEVVTALIGSVLTIVIAMAFPTLWGLVAGSLFATIAATVLSYFVRPGIKYRFALEKAYVWEIVSFGKWIFISSIIYFLAGNFDRLTLGKYIDLGVLGIYGVARSLGDIFGQFALRLGNAIIFPLVASADLDRPALRAKLSQRRIQFLAPAVCAMSLFIALSDLMVGILYDARYASAGLALPWIGLAMWFFILNTLSDSIMLGISRPANGAIGNVAKFATLLFMLPWAALRFGIEGAAMTMVAAELARYAILAIAQLRERVHFVRQDLFTTIAMLSGAFVVRAASHALGLTGSPAALFALAL